MVDRRLAILYVIFFICCGVLFFLKPLPQDPSFHKFVDTGDVAGVPNFWNVITNLPFFIVGAWGLFKASRVTERGPLLMCAATFFVGVFFTSFGSSYYHYNPNNDSLVWDRVPMTIAFNGFMAFIVGLRISQKYLRSLLAVLLILGVMSVFYWHYTEALGRGDLRAYGLVQFGVIVFVPLILFMFPDKRVSHTDVYLALGFYIVAKFLEVFDASIHQALGGFIGGHPLKHLSAGVSTYLLGRWMLKNCSS